MAIRTPTLAEIYVRQGHLAKPSRSTSTSLTRVRTPEAHDAQGARARGGDARFARGASSASGAPSARSKTSEGLMAPRPLHLRVLQPPTSNLLDQQEQSSMGAAPR